MLSCGHVKVALETRPIPTRKDHPRERSTESLDRWKAAALGMLVLAPILFNAIALFPEISLPAPSLNDDAVHYLLIQRASEALARGENVFDHWVPELELGFPVFFYYQHLPHLTIVALHRLLFQKVDLLTLFNIVRYLLLVGFPLTVYASMRRMGFSYVAAAAGAAGASLLSSNHRYGFEYDSYVWRGLGMYTQLWAMHLSFLLLACLDRVIERGTGYMPAILASTALLLSHLLYSYMLAITVLVLFFLDLRSTNLRLRLSRLALVGGAAALIGSYMWLPFLFQTPFLSASSYLQRWKYDSYGAGDILTWLVNGDLFDYGRFPALTVLVALGISVALTARSRPNRIALALFVLWLFLYFGRPTWGRLLNILPLHNELLLHRFVGGADIGVVFLLGLGGEWLWTNFEFLILNFKFKIQHSTFNLLPLAAALLLLALLLPAFVERRQFYSLNTQWLTRTLKAVEADADAREVLAALKTLPPGRAHAGLRANWGKELAFGDVHFYDLLTFHRIVANSPPYSSISLNADLIWHFDDQKRAQYDLLNVKYLVAPRRARVAEFLRPVKETRRYAVYQAPTEGYAGFVTVTDRRTPGSQPVLFFQNRAWFESDAPALKRAVRYDYPSPRAATVSAATSVAHRPAGCPGGAIRERSVSPGRFDLDVECPTAATIVLKETYHPNWRIAIDEREIPTFMLSPSFIGFELAPGRHRVRAEYRAAPIKTPLLILGAAALAALFAFGSRLETLDARLGAGKDGRR